MRGRRTALITGGTSGIGATLAQRLREDDWNVTVTAHTPVDACDQINTIVCDVRETEAVERAVASVAETHGRLDLLVASAATAAFATTATAANDLHYDLVNTNYLGVVRCAREALKVMTPQRSGSIVIMSSGWALMAPAGTGAYAASKAAVAAFAEALSFEAAPIGVDVHVVYPGYVPGTRLTDQALAAGMRPPPRILHRDPDRVAQKITQCIGRNEKFEVFLNPVERFSGTVRSSLPRLYRRVARSYQPFSTLSAGGR